jgi:hypothetical protein
MLVADLNARDECKCWFGRRKESYIQCSQNGENTGVWFACGVVKEILLDKVHHYVFTVFLSTIGQKL